jgi:hypothetical protein
MGIVAIIPVANLLAANAALEEQGFGPRNFSVQCFGPTGATHAALHCWPDAAFLAAVQALPGVVVNPSAGDPVASTDELIEAQGARWGDKLPELPSEGNVTAGQLYQLNRKIWSVIQSFDRITFPLPPETYPALLRELRRPGEVSAWRQPLDQFDAYKLVNPFTGLPDEATHLGQTWVVSQADGSGNNVWEPGVFGWTVQP